MSQPKVVCICLTADRQAYTDRAVRCFDSQDYENAQLLILDSGKRQWEPEGCSPRKVYYRWPIENPPFHGPAYIGTLRNAAIAHALADLDAEIIIHWDSDDYSGPTRISTQVKHLEESQAAAVGYREMLFWKSPREVRSAADMSTAALESGAASELIPGEAWLYSNIDPRYIVGTSLCYLTSAWQAVGGFADCHHGEDNDFLKRLRARGLKTEGAGFVFGREAVKDGTTILVDEGGVAAGEWQNYKPGRLLVPCVAEIHAGNTIKQHIFPEATNMDGSPQWQRKPDWDTHLRELLEGA